MRDGTTVVPLFGGNDIVPVVTAYTPYVSEPFRASSPVMTLEFADQALNTVQKVSWIDAVAIFPMPDVASIGGMSNGQFKLQFHGFTNIAYSVAGSTNMSLPMSNWTHLGTPNSQGSNIFQFIDTQSGNHPWRFYRVCLP